MAAKKKSAAKRSTAAKAKTPAKKKTSAKAKAVKHGPRADFGKPIEGFFAKQPAHLRAILDELRNLADEAAPDAQTSLKWGMPFYSIDGAMMCALGAHKAHVNLILAGPPDAFADPDGRLSGDGKSGRHLKLTSVNEIPRAEVRKWLKVAATRARMKAEG